MEFFQLVILTFAAAVHASMKNIHSHHADTKTLNLIVNKPPTWSMYNACYHLRWLSELAIALQMTVSYDAMQHDHCTLSVACWWRLLGRWWNFQPHLSANCIEVFCAGTQALFWNHTCSKLVPVANL